MTSPVFEARQPFSEFDITGIRSGGGGVNAAPEMREPVIMLDRIRIWKVEADAK